ncbi:MAG: hypothetical protein ACRDYU_08125 [Actinomycetes bacterium]
MGGDWVGAAATALSAWLVLVASSVALAATMISGDTSARGLLILTGSLVGAAFGGDTSLSAAGLQWSIGVYPLTLTCLTLVAAGWVFRRRLLAVGVGPDVRPELRGLLGAGLQAVRVGLVFVVLMVGSTLVLRGSVPDGASSLRLSVSPGLPAALGSLLLTLACLSVVLVVHRASLPAQVRTVIRWVAIPAKAIGVAFLGASVLTLIGGLVAIGVADLDDQRVVVASLIGCLPNVTLVVLYMGMGAALQVGGSGGELFTDTFGVVAAKVHVTTLTNEVSAWYWLIPVLTTLTVLAIAVLVVWFSRDGGLARSNLLRTVALAVLAAPFVTHLASLHTHLSGGIAENVRGMLGVDWPEALGLSLLWFIGAAVVGSALVPTILERRAAPVRTPPQPGQVMS